MSRELIAAKVPLPIGRELRARAKSRGLTISAYVAEVLRQHVSGGVLTFQPCRMGPEPAGKKAKIHYWTCGCGRQYGIGGSAAKRGFVFTCECGASKALIKKAKVKRG